MRKILCLTIIGLALDLIVGCDDSDPRLAQFAQESTRQQAEQNKAMAGVNKEMAESRKEMAHLQRDLAKQQTGVNTQRDQLEAERRAIAEHRHRDPVVANAIVQFGLIVACLLPLILAGFLVYRLCGDKADDLSNVLIEELTSEKPILLPTPPHADDQRDHRELAAPVHSEQV